MSLAITIYNHHGIVMGTDKLVNAVCDNKEFHQSYTEQKLFLIDDKYGLSYTGTASIDNIPVSALINEYLSKIKIGESEPSYYLLQLAKYFSYKLSNDQNIIFIMCGYFGDKKFIMTTNTQEPDVSIIDKLSGLIYSGENNFIRQIVDTKNIAFEFEKFTIRDSIDFIKFVIKTVAKMMYYGQYFPTVSKKCDILVICPNKVYWEKHS